MVKSVEWREDIPVDNGRAVNMGGKITPQVGQEGTPAAHGADMGNVHPLVLLLALMEGLVHEVLTIEDTLSAAWNVVETGHTINNVVVMPTLWQKPKPTIEDTIAYSFHKSTIKRVKCKIIFAFSSGSTFGR